MSERDREDVEFDRYVESLYAPRPYNWEDET
jgi:hypothetical protein